MGIKVGQMVRIVWGDAHSVEGIVNMEDLADWQALTTYTCGFLIQETNEGYVISLDTWQPEPPFLEGGTVHYIPKGMVIEASPLVPSALFSFETFVPNTLDSN